MRRSGRSLCLLAYTFIAAPNTYTQYVDLVKENIHTINRKKKIIRPQKTCENKKLIKKKNTQK